MTKEQWELYKDFCEYADIQDNSDAERPNCVASLKMFLEGTEIRGWDPLEDFSVLTPEMLTYILLKSKNFWEERSEK